jgi:UDP-2,3-diacylglucosamine hydrolase
MSILPSFIGLVDISFIRLLRWFRILRLLRFIDKKFLIGHGDGLGPGDKGYKRLKKIFRNPLSQWLFGILPPVLGIGLANYFSQKSRAQTGTSEEKFLGEDKEWLIAYCKEILKSKKYDYFIFGHRHLPIDFKLNESSRYINLGDWLKFDSYGFFDDLEFELKYYKPY